MKTITISITKKGVMGVVEGLSATIAQHNPEIDFETMWASDAEEAKLDIYYREAITDLENFLARFSSSTTQQFDLQALADDFSVTIKTLAYWPSRLSGVLTNQIQNYLVHAIMAGWLSDFPEFTHTDYAGMGANDLEAIKEVLLKKDFSFDEAARTTDSKAKSLNEQTVCSRTLDSQNKTENELTAEQRSSDSQNKTENELTAEQRSSDSQNKTENELSAEARTADGDGKQRNTWAAEARNADGVEKDTLSGTNASERNKDYMSQHFHEEYVDWSGGRPPFGLR